MNSTQPSCHPRLPCHVIPAPPPNPHIAPGPVAPNLIWGPNPTPFAARGSEVTCWQRLQGIPVRRAADYRRLGPRSSLGRRTLGRAFGGCPHRRTCAPNSTIPTPSPPSYPRLPRSLPLARTGASRRHRHPAPFPVIPAPFFSSFPRPFFSSFPPPSGNLPRAAPDTTLPRPLPSCRPLPVVPAHAGTQLPHQRPTARARAYSSPPYVFSAE